MKIPGLIKGLLDKRMLSTKPNSYVPVSSYTIISPAYNVAPYIDKFLESVMQQTIATDKLSIIIVDDGSTDSTAAIVEDWSSRYPGRIKLVSKENGGLSSARNAGIPFLETEWVTFSDPDDFLAPDYFEIVDRAFAKHPDAIFFASKIFPFDEETGVVSDKHPLNWRFSQGDNFHDVNSESLPISLSMATGFFQSSIIAKHELRCSTEVKPVFEDGHFVGRYLASEIAGSVGFIGSAKYYYRKRINKSSLVDRSWEGTDRLLGVPKKGHLDLFRFAQEARGYIPEFIKLTVLYDVGWYFRNHVDHPEICEHFTTEDIAEGRQLLEEDLRIIGYDTLFSPLNKSMGFDHKAALAKAYFHRNPPFQKVYLISADKEHSRLTFRTFVAMPIVLVNDSPIEPGVDVLQRNFLGEPFYNRYTLDVYFSDDEDKLVFDFGEDLPVQIDVKGKALPNGVTVTELLAGYRA